MKQRHLENRLFTLSVVLMQVLLNRFDLFHAHLFCTQQSHSLGMLFHTHEYPAYDAKHFPIHLGYCQQTSSLTYHPAAMDWRNLIWFQVPL